jgi:hypothetical protein
MNERQKTALKFPCCSPEDLLDQRYRKITHFGHLRVSTVLTVGKPETEWIWHASGSILGPDSKPVQLIGNVDKADFERLFMHLKSLVETVGEGGISTLPPNGAVLHFFRNLSPAEIEQIKKTSRFGN